MLDEIDFSPGKIIYLEFNFDKNKTVSEQIFEFKEDICQIEYDNGYLIDIGYYPEFSIDGNFKVYLIKDLDWENPIIEKAAASIDDLIIEVSEIVSYVRKRLKKKD